jgi:hypothetical protein
MGRFSVTTVALPPVATVPPVCNSVYSYDTVKSYSSFFKNQRNERRMAASRYLQLTASIQLQEGNSPARAPTPKTYLVATH